ncbi:MAG: UDP-N-acetylmuramate--L-alanine ligase, partial [Candidatus Omnitrophica bacterium]|nr:UDP-N-acetylmuramate--L-alanine ligase [Candidatus Omnitrophota bacterium]
ALAELMKDKTVIAVTGSHGKTTTSSLVAYLLLEAGLSPTAAVGGILKNINSNACLGKGKFFVAEADESDGSFLYYRPQYSIITNIDREHLDYYKNFQNVLLAYRQFLNRTQPDGTVFCCADDPNLKQILKDYKHRRVFFGLNQDADIYPKNITVKDLNSEFDCYYKDKLLCRFYLALGGRHNISNALAVIALSLELKIDLSVTKKILAGYQGAKRRLEVKFKDDKYLLIDDYAHHPTEIQATLSAVQNLKYNRLIAIFQPHRYSRTQILADDFARSFDLVDKLVLTEIYPAGEPVLAGVSSDLLCRKIKDHSPQKKVDCLKKEEVVRYILEEIKPGDLVITLGAGDITKINDELAEALKGKS